MNMESEKKKQLYAKVLLDCGIQLKPGHSVCVEASRSAEDFVALIEAEAALHGSHVLTIWRGEAAGHGSGREICRRRGRLYLPGISV